MSGQDNALDKVRHTLDNVSGYLGLEKLEEIP